MPAEHSAAATAAYHQAMSHKDTRPASEPHQDVDTAAADQDAHEAAVQAELPHAHPTADDLDAAAEYIDNVTTALVEFRLTLLTAINALDKLAAAFNAYDDADGEHDHDERSSSGAGGQQHSAGEHG